MIQPEELKRVPIFACLTDVQRERIAQNAADLRVEKGEWLIREGEVPSFFVLLEGVLEVEKEYGGASQVRGRYQPGDFYGETPILLDSPPSRRSVRTHLPASFAWIVCSSKSFSTLR
jgi:thioredoxin reductase (NADPH)